MKKKGMILATIVMVVVLVASLTTATYAWFTSTATATISQMNVTTSAAKGLQIAAVTYDNNNAPTAYNGTLSLDTTSHKWVGSEQNGYGSELSLSPSVENSQYLLEAMYGASGDGKNMFIQTDTAFLPSATNPMKLGTENLNYVALDFSLMATSAGTAYINQIYVDPTTLSLKSGMAGAMRIALFATAPGTPLASGAPTWDISTNGKMLYIPYGLSYNGVLFSATIEANKYYTAAGYDLVYYDEANETGEDYVLGSSITTMTAISGSFDSTKYYKVLTSAEGADVVAYLTADAAKGAGTLSAGSLQATWSADKVVYGTKTASSGKTLGAVGNDPQHLYADLAAANAALVNQANTPAGIASLGAMTANQVIYGRLVIWFEGESAACNKEFSGGGAQVTVNFSLDPTVTA